MKSLIVGIIKNCMANVFVSTFLYLATLALDLVIGLPTRISAKLRGTIQFLDIYGKNAEIIRVKIVDSDNWLRRNAFLFPLIISGKISLVGISLRRVDDEDLPRDLYPYKPGLISLYFIRMSSRLAESYALDCDREYIRTRKPFTDIGLLMQAMIALILHQSKQSHENQLDIFGIKMLNLTMKDAISMLERRIDGKIHSPAYFVNADCLNKVLVDKDYLDILKNNEIVFPDGSGVNLAAKMLGSYLKENVNGTDMLPHLCELAQARGYRIFLLGAAEGVAKAMSERLLDTYPQLNICGFRNGYFDWDNEAESVINEINLAQADILLIAFGAPLQEKFIHRFGEMIHAPLQMGVGGLFDFYSGRITRAPIWMRQTGLEWVFRLIQEPGRMWRRYILGNPLFVFRVYRWNKNERKQIF